MSTTKTKTEGAGKFWDDGPRIVLSPGKKLWHVRNWNAGTEKREYFKEPKFLLLGGVENENVANSLVDILAWRSIVRGREMTHAKKQQFVKQHKELKDSMLVLGMTDAEDLPVDEFTITNRLELLLVLSMPQLNLDITLIDPDYTPPSSENDQMPASRWFAAQGLPGWVQVGIQQTVEVMISNP